MTAAETGILEAKDKQHTAAPAEYTRPGLTFTPAIDIFETEAEITLLADLPGVKAGQLDIDLREGVLTVAGNITAPEGSEETDVLREFQVGRYLRRFTLSDTIDQSRINAQLSDGVLRLVLPKAAKAVPRKIVVTA